jgi:hypothetical protein
MNRLVGTYYKEETKRPVLRYWKLSVGGIRILKDKTWSYKASL